MVFGADFSRKKNENFHDTLEQALFVEQWWKRKGKEWMDLAEQQKDTRKFLQNFQKVQYSGLLAGNFDEEKSKSNLN